MNTKTIQTHYAAPGLLDRIEEGLTKLGKTPTAITIDDLAPVDEFHVRGAAATTELIQLLAPTAEMHILDLGSGLGGPARRLAQSTGCTVTGVDLSADYCVTGTTLNTWCGLASKVRLQPGDVTDLAEFADGTFDGAWTIHVGMNVADKAAFYNGVYRVLKPGAAFVIYDLFTTGDQAIHFPVPWAKSVETSFLLTINELETHLAQAGFTQPNVHDLTAAGLAFLQRVVTQFDQPGPPPPLGLHLAVGALFRTMFQSLHQNVAEGRVALAALHTVRPA